MAGGVMAGGTKYQFLREEDGKLVMAKKKEHGALTMQASKTGIYVRYFIYMRYLAWVSLHSTWLVSVYRVSHDSE